MGVCVMASLDDIWGILKQFPKLILWLYDQLTTIGSNISTIYNWVNTIQGWAMGAVASTVSTINTTTSNIKTKTDTIDWNDITGLISSLDTVDGLIDNIVDLLVTQTPATVQSFLESLISKSVDAFGNAFTFTLLDDLRLQMFELAKAKLEDVFT